MNDDSFSVFLADTDKSRQIHFSLRHAIFCEELHWFDPKEGEKWERDEYDAYSAHFLLKDNRTEQWAGTLRIVHGALEQLPLCRHVTFYESALPQDLGSTTAEYSRFSLTKDYRGNKDQSLSIGETPELILSLMFASTEYCLDNHIRYIYFVTQKALARLLGSYGIPLQQIGPKCQLFGERYPYILDLNQARQTFKIRKFALPKASGAHNFYQCFSTFEKHNEARQTAHSFKLANEHFLRVASK